MRAVSFCRILVYNSVAAAAASRCKGMPKCLMGCPSCCKGDPSDWFHPCQVRGRSQSKSLTSAIYTFVAANRARHPGWLPCSPTGTPASGTSAKEGSALWTYEASLQLFRPRSSPGCWSQSSFLGSRSFDFWLYRSSAWLASQAQPPAAPHQHVWQLGRFLPFSSYALAAAPQRLRSTS